MARINAHNTRIYLEDGAGVTLELPAAQGDLSVSNLAADDNRETIVARPRGSFDGFVKGAELEQEISITLEIPSAQYTSAAVAKVIDWIKRTGIYHPSTGSVALTSVDACSWAYKLRVTHTECGIEGGYVLPTTKLIVSSFSEAADMSTLSLSGTNYTAPVFT